MTGALKTSLLCAIAFRKIIMTNNQGEPQQLPMKPMSIHITRIKSNACYFRKQKLYWDKTYP